MVKKIKKSDLNGDLANVDLTGDLPPAGYKRDEVLAKRQDDLEEQAEKESNKTGMQAIDPNKLEEDRDIQRVLHQKRDPFHIDLGPEWKVCYKDYIHHNGSQAWYARNEGWIPVTRELLPKSEQYKCREDGTVRIGDVMAFCMPIDKFKEIEKERHQAMLRDQYGIEAAAYDYAEKHSDHLKFYSSFTGENPHMDTMQKRAARKMALGHIGNKMKQGPIKGIPIR
jgi:hypothetical protein